MCFSEPDYITVRSVMNIMTANGAKIAQKCHNNVLKLLLFGTCLKRVVISTQ